MICLESRRYGMAPLGIDQMRAGMASHRYDRNPKRQSPLLRGYEKELS